MFDYTPLRILMAKNNINWTVLREELALHPTTIAKINRDEYISPQALDKICQYFKCQLNDIVEIKKDWC